MSDPTFPDFRAPDPDKQASGHGPMFKSLAADLRALTVQRRREQGAAIVAKAQRLMHEGKITPADLIKLHALNLRLEGGR